MASIDNHNGSAQVIALNTTAIAAAATTNGNWVNTLSQDCQFQSVEFLVQIGAAANFPATLNFLVQEADLADFSDAATVAAQDLLPSPSQGGIDTVEALLTGANTSCRFGYIGQKTYVRLSLVSTGGTVSYTASAMAFLSDARFQPTLPDVVIGTVGYDT